MMKNIILFIGLLSLSFFAQNITNAEYFLDTDPGYGNGIQVPVSAASDITLDFSVDLNAIIDGFHILYFRVKDDSARWSIAYSKPFYKQSLLAILPEIVQLEYFIDTDPGIGNGVNISITSGQAITVDFNVDLIGINDGFHVLYVRGKDSDGKWSITHSKPFYKQSLIDILPDVTEMEYYIDNDPGFGNGENIAITSGQDITVNFAADLSAIDDGFHVLYVRGKDDIGAWNITHSKPFYKDTPKHLNDITEIEYFISNVDTITPVYTYSNFTAAPDVDVNLGADISSLARNTNFYFHITGKDCTGIKSIEYTHEFLVESTNIPPQIVSALSDVHVNEDFGTTIIADLDTIFTDPDGAFGDSLSYSIILNSGKINAQLNSSILQITSVSDSNGVVPVIIRAEDDSLASVRDTFLVNIASINDPPMFSNLPDSVEFNADTLALINIWSFVEDIETADSLLNYDFDVSNDSLLWIFDPDSGALRLSSQQMYSGADTLFITVTDDSGAAINDSVLVFIYPPTAIFDDFYNQIPKELVLQQNYPNPFNPTTKIRYGLPKATKVKIELYNVIGQKIKVIKNSTQAAGFHEIILNAYDMSSGVYFYCIQADQYSKIRKMILLK
jgi:hypothetical protein